MIGAEALAMAAMLLAAVAAPSDETLRSASPAIDQANRDWAAAMRAGDADQAVRAYADDALFVTPDGEVAKGRSTIRGFYARRFAVAGPALDAAARSEGRAAIDADDVYEWGEAWVTVKVAGTLQRRGGRFITVWRRYRGSGWRISRNFAL